MSTSPLSPHQSTATAPGENSRRELQARLAGLGDLNGKKLTPEAKAKKLREACEGFESVFIQKMWQEMRNTLPKNGLLQGRDERFWQDMYDQELAKSMTSAGGIGLADMMYEQLSRNLVSASRSTAGAGQFSAFTPTAAPLLAQSAPQDAQNTEHGTHAPAQSLARSARPAAPNDSAGMSAAIYDGPAPTQGANTPLEKKGAQVTNQVSATAATAAQDAPLSNPEIERALASLRSQQALMRNNEVTRAEVAPSRRQNGASGLELARMAQREAGDKLGPHSVRPPLRRNTQPSANAGQAHDTAPMAETAQRRRVRYTTNMPELADKGRAAELSRNLIVDAVSTNSRAGAGLAAYHATQGQASPAEAMQQPIASSTSPQPQTGIAPLTARDMVEGSNKESFAIPPLTAAHASS